MFIVDLEHMLKVLLPPHAAVSHHQLCRVKGQPLRMTTLLRQSNFRGSSFGNIWCCPLCPTGATGRLATISPSSGLLPPMVLGGLTTSGGSFVRGGVKCDSPPSGLSWRLYCLLIWGCSLARWWLMERWCHLGNAQHQHRQHLSPLGWSPWTWHLLCPSMPLYSAPNHVGPPNAR